MNGLTNGSYHLIQKSATVLRIGKSHPTFKYKMKKQATQTELKVVKEEKDLGVVIDHCLNFESHINQVTNKATRIMGIIRRSYTYLGQENFVALFTALVRSQLEYAVQAWAPSTARHMTVTYRPARSCSKTCH